MRIVKMGKGLIVQSLCAGLVGFAVGLLVLNIGGSSPAAQAPATNMVQATPPLRGMPAYLPSQMEAPRIQVRPSPMMAKAPEISFVKSDRAMMSTSNYNNVDAALTGRWGVGQTSNGRNVENLYGNVKIPEVGERPTGTELNKALTGDEIKARGWGATKAGAMFGNEKYELLDNNLKPVLAESKDIKAKAQGLATGGFGN